MPRRNAIKSINKLAKRIPVAVAKAAEDAIRDVEAEAKATTVFKDRTGNHRASIRGALDPQIGIKIQAVLKAGMYYSPFLELGTSRMSPRPHLWPAMRRILQGRDQFQNALRSEFRKIRIY